MEKLFASAGKIESCNVAGTGTGLAFVEFRKSDGAGVLGRAVQGTGCQELSAGCWSVRKSEGAGWAGQAAGCCAILRCAVLLLLVAPSLAAVLLSGRSSASLRLSALLSRCLSQGFVVFYP